MARARTGYQVWGSLMVLIIVGLVWLGLPALDRSLPSGRMVSAQEPYQVSGAVTVLPPAGATLDVSGTRPNSDRGTALFVVEGVRLAVVVSPYRGTLHEGAMRLRNKITKSSGFQIVGSTRPIRTDQGMHGIRGRYTSPGRTGEYAVFVAHDTSVEVTVSGPEHQLRRLLPRLEASIDSIAVRSGP